MTIGTLVTRYELESQGYIFISFDQDGDHWSNGTWTVVIKDGTVTDKWRT